ncbi:hypothetical protein ACHAPT_012909 [Fusarium lateritium]
MASRLRYIVVTSLDGFIATNDNSTNWFIKDPNVDFEALANKFETTIVGRKTYELMQHAAAEAGYEMFKDQKTHVFTTQLKQEDHPDVKIITGNAVDAIKNLKASNDGKDIWLMGGGSLARMCLQAGLLDTVETAIMPVLLGDGIPLLGRLPGEEPSVWKLELVSVKKLDSGILRVKYKVV